MKADYLTARRSGQIWLTPEACDIEEFVALVERRADPALYPLAATMQSNVPVYDGAAIRAAAADEEPRKALMAEWAWALRSSSYWPRTSPGRRYPRRWSRFRASTVSL